MREAARGEALRSSGARMLSDGDLARSGPLLRSSFAAKDACRRRCGFGRDGGGKKATDRTHFCFANDNLEAYGVGTHRHTPEIEQILGICGRLVFTPHLAPLNRGILSTVTIPLAAEAALPTSEGLSICT